MVVDILIFAFGFFFCMYCYNNSHTRTSLNALIKKLLTKKQKPQVSDDNTISKPTVVIIEKERRN